MESLQECMLTYNIRKSKTERQPDKPSTNALPMFLSVCLLWLNSTEMTLCSGITKDILHMFVIHQIENYHTEFAKREGERMKVKGKKTKNVAARDFPHCFFVCLYYSSKKPPTLHHVGRNQSQTGTYLWTLLLPERNSSYSEKSPLNV